MNKKIVSSKTTKPNQKSFETGDGISNISNNTSSFLSKKTEFQKALKIHPTKDYCSTCKHYPCTCPKAQITRRISKNSSYIRKIYEGQALNRMHNNSDWESWPSEKLSRILQQSVQHFLENDLKKWGIKIDFLSKFNKGVTYGLSGTSYVGNKLVTTAEILYPNAKNMVFEKGKWIELRFPRIVLPKNAVQQLLNREYLMVSNFELPKVERAILSEGIQFVLHELIHLLIRNTRCGILPSKEDAGSIIKNEELTNLLVEVIEKNALLYFFKTSFSNKNNPHKQRGSKTSNEKLKEISESLAGQIAQIEQFGQSSCLKFLLKNYSISETKIRRKQNTQNQANKNLVPIDRKIPVFSKIPRVPVSGWKSWPYAALSWEIQERVTLLLNELEKDGVIPYIKNLEICNKKTWYAAFGFPSYPLYYHRGLPGKEPPDLPAGQTFVSKYTPGILKYLKDKGCGTEIKTSWYKDSTGPLIKQDSSCDFCDPKQPIIGMPQAYVDIFLRTIDLVTGKVYWLSHHLPSTSPTSPTPPAKIFMQETYDAIIHELFHVFSYFFAGIPSCREEGDSHGSEDASEVFVRSVMLLFLAKFSLVKNWSKDATNDYNDDSKPSYQDRLIFHCGNVIAAGGENSLRYLFPPGLTANSWEKDWEDNWLQGLKIWRNRELPPQEKGVVFEKAQEGVSDLSIITKKFEDFLDFLIEKGMETEAENFLFLKFDFFSQYTNPGYIELTPGFTTFFIPATLADKSKKTVIVFNSEAKKALWDGNFLTTDKKALNRVFIELLYSLVYLFIRNSSCEPPTNKEEKERMVYGAKYDAWLYRKSDNPYRSPYTIGNYSCWITNWLRMQIEESLANTDVERAKKRAYSYYYLGGIHNFSLYNLQTEKNYAEAKGVESCFYKLTGKGKGAFFKNLYNYFFFSSGELPNSRLQAEFWYM